MTTPLIPFDLGSLPEEMRSWIEGLAARANRTERAEMEARLLREKLRLILIGKYGKKSESLSDDRLTLMELEPSVREEEVAREADVAQEGKRIKPRNDEGAYRRGHKIRLVHSVEGTAANVVDVTETHALLHGEERHVFAEAGYLGTEKRPEVADKAKGVKWYVAAKRGQVKAMPEGALKEATQAFERSKALVRALVEHPFHIIKNLFRPRKTRYRGLAKNFAQLETLFTLANIVIAKRSLLSECRA